jgi:hypothetical protein
MVRFVPDHSLVLLTLRLGFWRTSSCALRRKTAMLCVACPLGIPLTSSPKSMLSSNPLPRYAVYRALLQRNATKNAGQCAMSRSVW